MEERNRLLIVDDNKENVRVLIEILKRDYQLNAVTDSFKVVETAKKWRPDVILLDVVMPGISGYDVCMQLKACEETKCIPVIFVTGISDIEEEIACISTGALDYVTKPINPRLLNAKIKNFINIKNDRSVLAKLLAGKRAAIEESAGPLTGIGGDEPADKHIRSCVEYTKVLVKALISNVRFSELLCANLAENICKAVVYHDIGMSALPENMRLAPEELAPLDFELTKAHVTTGWEMLSSGEAGLTDEGLLKIAKEMARSHHERWDGTGYPDGLKGAEIPLSARIMAIADQYDALTSKRIYNEPSYHFEAVRAIVSETGKGFDPELVQEFLNVQDEFLAVLQKGAYSDDEEPKAQKGRKGRVRA